MITVDVRGKLKGGTARLTADGHGRASGHFLPGYGSFMPLRHSLDHAEPEPRVGRADDPVRSRSHIDPATLRYGTEFGFRVRWHLPDVIWSPATEDGQAGVGLRTPDGSRA